MKPKRIVFIPVIAVIAGFSAFMAVLLICLDLFPAIAGEREGVAKAGEKRHEVEKRATGELLELGRAVGEFGAKARVERKDGGKREPQERPPAPELSAGERIGHLVEAAEHLQLAGFQDEAGEWRDRAEEMRLRNHAEAENERIESLVDRVQELQEAMGRMGQEVERLQRELSVQRKSRD